MTKKKAKNAEAIKFAMYWKQTKGYWIQIKRYVFLLRDGGFTTLFHQICHSDIKLLDYLCIFSANVYLQALWRKSANYFGLLSKFHQLFAFILEDLKCYISFSFYWDAFATICMLLKTQRGCTKPAIANLRCRTGPNISKM